MRRAFEVVSGTLREFFFHQPFQLAAALSYYALLSAAPLLLVAVSVAGIFYDRGAAREELLAYVEDYVGREGAETVDGLLAGAAQERDQMALIGIVLLLAGSTTVFYQLQIAMNRIWSVEPQPQAPGWRVFLQHRLWALILVLLIGILLLASLVVGAVLSAMSSRSQKLLELPAWVWSGVDLAVTLVMLTVLVAMIFRFLPDARTDWRYLWRGAAVTAVLITLGRFGLGLYLGRTGTSSSYGAAGSIVVLMAWVYYTALILFLGGEITRAWARLEGRRPEPKAFARRVASTLQP